MKFKVIIPNLLYFDTGHFVNGKQEGRGYYFKGKWISRYKSVMIEEMRKVFHDNFSEENKKKFEDEWKVVHYFYEIGKKATKIAEQKKKIYYAERRRLSLLGKIAREKIILGERMKKLLEQEKELEEKIK